MPDFNTYDYTQNYNLPYPNNNQEDADLIENLQKLAEATDSALEGKADSSDIPDLTDYVKNDDYASGTTGGVFKTSSGYGTEVSTNGFLRGVSKDYATYGNADVATLISKGTLENVLAAVVGDINSMLDEINGEVI